MFHHEYIVDDFAAWVNGDVSTLEAFANLCPVHANQFMVSAFILNFPGATPLDSKELDNLPRPPTRKVRVVRRAMGPLSPDPASPVPRHQLPCFCGMSMLCQQQCCEPSIASNQLPGVLWWYCGSSSS